MAASFPLRLQGRDCRIIFEQYIGTYEWGGRDCLNLMCDLLSGEDNNDVREASKDYLSLATLEEAVKKCIDEHGSVGATYSNNLKSIDSVEVLVNPDITERIAGDVMWIEGEVVTTGGDTLTVTDDEDSCIAFVDNALNIMIWSSLGLVRIGGEITVKEIWRVEYD